MKIPIRDDWHLSSFRESDKAALLEHLHSRDVYNTTLNIPHPYLEKDADFWIQKRIEHTRRQGIEVCFAIRDADEKLLGTLGAATLEVPGRSAHGIEYSSLPGSHRAEIGYWLARPFWGQQIMTDAVRAYVRYAFTELGLLRLTADVLQGNLASARVLEKNGFKLEGYLRQHIRKDGRLLDVSFYGLLRDDVAL
jgi:ribosomal-protein-alanine N-acetyltransferase